MSNLPDFSSWTGPARSGFVSESAGGNCEMSTFVPSAQYIRTYVCIEHRIPGGVCDPVRWVCSLFVVRHTLARTYVLSTYRGQRRNDVASGPRPIRCRPGTIPCT